MGDKIVVVDREPFVRRVGRGRGIAPFLALAVALTVGSLLGGSASGSTFPGFAGKIFFVRDAGGTGSIYSVNPDGSGLVRLTNPGSSAFDNAPRVSPDGRLVTFERDASDGSSFNIWIMNSDGSGQHQLTTTSMPVFAFSPTFSADGRSIVYGVNDVNNSRTTGLYAMDASGANQRLLTGVGHLTPTFSPDGLHLAFVTVGSSGPQLQVGASNGAGARPVYTAVPGSGMTSEPDWSPDGRSLLIADKGGIEQVPAGGGSARTLLAPSGGGFFATPSYSPDGSRLVFAASPASGRQSGLFISSASGTGMTAIPGTGTATAFDSQPDWAVPPGTGVTVQQQDLEQACASPLPIDPQTVLGGGDVTVPVTIDVPGTLDITVAEGTGGSTLPVARDPGASVHAAAGGQGSTLPVLKCQVTFEGGGSTLPVARDARAAKPVTLAHLDKTFTKRAKRLKLRVPLTHAGRLAFKRLLALDKAYFKKHPHGHHAPRLKLKLTIKFTPQV